MNLQSLIRGEHDENELREDFRPSERVAIAEAVREELGNRQGQRTELGKNISEVTGRTEDEAAARAGFGNRTTYRQAKTVTSHGAPELIEAMDAGLVAISTAAVVHFLLRPLSILILTS